MRPKLVASNIIIIIIIIINIQLCQTECKFYFISLMYLKHNGVPSTKKKKFKVFRKYSVGQTRDGKGCPFKGFVFDCVQKMEDQAQREELSDSRKHESVSKDETN